MPKVLIVVQVALSLFLLIGAGLFVRSLQNLKNLDAGFDRENVVLFGLDTGRDYTPARQVQLQQQLLERLESLPGARSASISHLGLLSGGRTTNNIAVAGDTRRPDEDRRCFQLQVGRSTLRRWVFRSCRDATSAHRNCSHSLGCQASQRQQVNRN